ncbi:MAG: hypothetical protein ATN31_04935 [Candidatus Epulonipiscioides saccharophilum]|nr:MAG: hypothetical protein ATN31_04935 [Epulopiscium sp. AS2M-Bin001]
MINNDDSNNQHNYKENNFISTDRKDLEREIEKALEDDRDIKKLMKFVTGMVLFSIVSGGIAGSSYALINDYLTKQNPIDVPVVTKSVPTAVSNVLPITSMEKKNTITDIAENVGPAIVSIVNNQYINTWPVEYQASGLGSGVIFKEDETNIYIITNTHVVEGAESLIVTFLGNEKVNAKVLGSDSLTDIAVVTVEKKDVSKDLTNQLSVAPLGDSDSVRVGDLAIAIGTPLDEAYNNTVTAGIISATNRTIDISTEGEMRLIQTDAAINPGNSGGALIGPTGEVIAINTIKLVDDKVEGMGFAIPINDVKLIVDELLENGRIIRPSLGITGATMTQDVAQFEIPVGVYVATVLPGSSAAIAGLKPNDIILEFDGNKIMSIEELRNLLGAKEIGDRVDIRISRSGDIFDLKLILTELEQPAITDEIIKPEIAQSESNQADSLPPEYIFPFGR